MFFFIMHCAIVIVITALFALVSYFVLLICYSAIWLLSRKCGIKLSVSVSVLSNQHTLIR